MVKKVLGFLNRETRTLHEAAYLLGLFAILSQILAFLRDRLLAHHFGASGELDIYYAAFRIPDFLFVTVASVVSISVLVPFIVERDRQSKESVREFLGNVFSFFSVLMIVSAGVVFFLMPYISEYLFQGFSEKALDKVILVSRIMLLSPVALGFSNLFGSITQAYNRFVIYAFAPLLYNIGIIFGIVSLESSLGVVGVALGVVLGAMMHAFVQVPFILKNGLFPRLSFSFNFSSVKKVVLLSMPRTLALSTNQIALIFLVSFASLMSAGSISVLSLSLNLQSVPLSIIGVSYSLAAFPTLSRHFADKNMTAFIHQMVTTTKHIIFWSLPIMALFVVLRAQIVRVLLGTGRFDWNDTRLTAAALAIFVVSSLSQSLLILFMRAFYAAGQTLKPFVINLLSAGVLVLSSYGMIQLFDEYPLFGYFLGALLKVGDIPNILVLVLPIGYAIGTLFNSIVHWVAFERDFANDESAPKFTGEILGTLFEAFSTSIIMGAVAYYGLILFAPLYNLNSLLGIFLQGFSAGILAIVVGVALLYFLGSKELRDVWKAIHSKFWKSKVIATDPEIV